MKKPGKKAVLQAVLAAHQAGVQKGAAMASQRATPPPGIAGLPPGGPAGMKAGGVARRFAEGGSTSAPKPIKIRVLKQPPLKTPTPDDLKEAGAGPAKFKGGGKVAPKEKWTPPWAKKGKKFAAGGCVGGGRGDGCATKGRTKGRMV